MTEAAKEDANKILDELNLPNYDDVEMRLAQPEMTATKQRNYLDFVIRKRRDKKKTSSSYEIKRNKRF